MPVHQAKFLQPLKSGQRFTIKGRVADNPKRFMINLVENDDEGKNKNIILHISPRFDEEKCVIVRNTNIMGHWGPKEKDGGFPLGPGKNFEAVIVVHDDCYKILFDGKQFCEYKHRAPVEMVTHLIVDGDVSLQQGRPNADEDEGIQVDTMIKNFMHLMCIPSRGYNFPVPYNKPLVAGLHEGSLVYIRCRTPDQYNRFTINFVEDSHDNKALHFDVRFDHLGDRELVVRNAKTKGSFRRDESERSIPKFPFAPGKDFDIVFLCIDDRFKIAVNGEHFVDFKYRQKDLTAIQKLNINGDLILRLVLVC